MNVPTALSLYRLATAQDVADDSTPAVDAGTFVLLSITWQADGFGFDATSGEFFTASTTALLVMRCLSQGLSRPQILDCISAAYDVPRRTAERDLESFFAELTHLGLTDLV